MYQKSLYRFNFINIKFTASLFFILMPKTILSEDGQIPKALPISYLIKS